jgi:uncharacterized protein (TIGR02271 family)
MKTIIALFDHFDQAEAAVDALVAQGVNRSDISLVANNASGRYSDITTAEHHEEDAVKAGQGAAFGAVVGGLVGLGALLIPGIGPVIAAGPLAAALGAGVGAAAGAATGGITAALVKTGVPEEDATVYAEGIREGGTLVTVHAADSDAYVAEQILSQYGGDTDTNERADRTGTGVANGTTRSVGANEQVRLQEVEEELHVGKRDVERGGVRVSTYVTETPVEEQVQLREEHVTVDRHPVDRPATREDLDTFEEGTIELTEHAEEAVVQKTARVTEEVVVGKEVDTHTETVSDTVRRKEVDVEHMGSGSATGARSWDQYDNAFRNHYNQRYANTGTTYEQYQPAFQYGYTLANDQRYRDYDWNRLEPEARRRWETEHHDSPWESFKDAVQDAWRSVRNSVD